MSQNTLHIKKWLLPLSWLYGFVVFIRNKMFDWKILKQKSYDIPVICVGNITVGGTGKTPHTEHLIELLQSDHRVAVLSRGYKRKSKGFVLACKDSTVDQIGDEPYQIKGKFPEIIVAVDSERQRGIETLLALPEDKRPDVILLDDAFQHRYVKPSFTILLTDYNRLMTKDKLLPAGRLREPVYYAEKANVVIVTKCPDGITPLDLRLLAKEIQVYPYQDLFYTSFRYGSLTPVFAENKEELSLKKLQNKDVLIVAGIANPRPFFRKVKRYVKQAETIQYPDHYQFTSKDILDIKSRLASMGDREKVIIVTEKDAARLLSMDNVDDEIKSIVYYLPIRVSFVNEEDKKLFNNKIVDHVRENS
ncbi:tetraacyldisaccharide 4'-kinase [Dysgonomonas sp. HDW5A]|uniref:tetraacyldisaccharide 4'-kinase n=1 Tax=Dysgonomonas sp. HDW5A TaxID=2714926 RepID=UPI00140C8633|nr:tetraacyldisaccharide 4'-kinase [Dysgonomonas sp. HDW5A]QIK59331.1 tetraacyldisaccharide 4'-kinase [Dysgonomonas sp. HDW5A]